MKYYGPTHLCVLCDKPIFQGHSIDTIPIQGYTTWDTTVHEDCAKAYYENWALR